MLCHEIIRILEAQSPTEYAMEWDNVGLLVGKRDKDVKKVMIAVDATMDVCEKAIGANVDMIITHHPMIFSKINRVNSDTVLGQKIMNLIEAGICCYAMHTNFDTKGGMAKLAADMLNLSRREVLEETLNGEGIGQIGYLEKSISLYEMACRVKKEFDLINVIIYGDGHSQIERVAVSPGSGKSVIGVSCDKHVDCLITGDIGHHDALDAMEMGLCIIDASHYGIEKIFMQYIYNYIKDLCPDIECIIEDVGEPFEVV